MEVFIAFSLLLLLMMHYADAAVKIPHASQANNETAGEESLEDYQGRETNE